jgi:hypothetical protein
MLPRKRRGADGEGVASRAELGEPLPVDILTNLHQEKLSGVGNAVKTERDLNNYARISARFFCFSQNSKLVWHVLRTSVSRSDNPTYCEHRGPRHRTHLNKELSLHKILCPSQYHLSFVFNCVHANSVSCLMFRVCTPRASRFTIRTSVTAVFRPQRTALRTVLFPISALMIPRNARDAQNHCCYFKAVGRHNQMLMRKNTKVAP